MTLLSILCYTATYLFCFLYVCVCETNIVLEHGDKTPDRSGECGSMNNEETQLGIAMATANPSSDSARQREVLGAFIKTATPLLLFMTEPRESRPFPNGHSSERKWPPGWKMKASYLQPLPTPSFPSSHSGLLWQHRVGWRPDPQQPGRPAAPERSEDPGHQPPADRPRRGAIRLLQDPGWPRGGPGPVESPQLLGERRLAIPDIQPRAGSSYFERSVAARKGRLNDWIRCL